MPILPLVDKVQSDDTELRKLFDEGARSLMFGVSYERAHDTAGSLTRGSKMGFAVTPRVVATSDGNTLVNLNGRMISVYDTSADQPRLVSTRTVNDLKETVGSGPWLKVNSNAYSELALSSDGSLLAVAQERTIQIYDLNADPDSFTVNEYVASASGHYICGLDFEQNDHVLRVRLSGKGTVVYLGTPAPEGQGEVKADLEHWKSRAGLRHVFLDSSLLVVDHAPNGDLDPTSRISGIQLLQQFEHGYLFGGQRHGGGESSHYILFHVHATTSSHNLPAMTAQPNTVTILARLESFLSSWKFTLDASSERGLGLWENMPSAHEHHPRFAITSEGGFDLLALAERDKKRIRPARLTQIFLYRLPNRSQCRSKIAAQKHLGEQSHMDHTNDTARAGSKEHFVVPRMPLCLTTLQNDVNELEFTRVDRQTCALSASTVETTRTWIIRDS